MSSKTQPKWLSTGTSPASPTKGGKLEEGIDLQIDAAKPAREQREAIGSPGKSSSQDSQLTIFHSLTPTELGPSTPLPPLARAPCFRVSVESPDARKTKLADLSRSGVDLKRPSRLPFPPFYRLPSEMESRTSSGPQAPEDPPDPTDNHALPLRLKPDAASKSSTNVTSQASDKDDTGTKPISTSPFRVGFPDPLWDSPGPSHIPTRDLLFSPAPSVGLPARPSVSSPGSPSFNAGSVTAPILSSKGSSTSYLAAQRTDTSPSMNNAPVSTPASNVAFPAPRTQKGIPGCIGSIRILTAVEDDQSAQWSFHGSKKGTLAPAVLFKNCNMKCAPQVVAANPSILDFITTLNANPMLDGWELIDILPIEESESGRVWIVFRKE